MVLPFGLDFFNSMLSTGHHSSDSLAQVPGLATFGMKPALRDILQSVDRRNTIHLLSQQFERIDEEDKVNFSVARANPQHLLHRAAVCQLYARWDLDRYNNIIPFEYNRVRLKRPWDMPGQRRPATVVPRPTRPCSIYNSLCEVLPSAEESSAGEDTDNHSVPRGQAGNPDDEDEEEEEEDPHESDYINASWILPPWGPAQCYIATQGPLSNTVGDFWSMIWQHQTQVIVMLTREVEKRMLKCDVYWPSFVAAANHPDPRGSPMAAAGLEFRELGIGVYPVREYADRALGAIVREVEVRALPGLEDVANRLAPTFSPSSTESAYTPAAGATPPLQPLRVTQFHYQCWPDHDAPSDLPQFHRLHLAIRACQAQTPGAPGCQPPIVIHCSAGCGRTGTFITLDWMLQALQAPHLQKAAAPPSLPPSRPSENVSATTRATEGTGHHTITGWPEVPGQVTDVLKPLADERFERYRLLPPDQRAAAGNPLFDLVRYLRTQRVSMVQSTVQYLFCYRVLAELWQRGVIKLD